MKQRLVYGKGQLLELEIPEPAKAEPVSEPCGEPLDALEREVRASLAQPMDFPPLTQATVPGDRIVLALGQGVPQAVEVARIVIDVLVQGGTPPENITVLLPEAVSAAERQAASPRLPPGVVSAVHDPAQPAELAYLAASKDNKPIYVNRHIVDADLVLPIGCLRPAGAFGYCGVHSGWFPTFSDVKTQQRYRAPNSSLSPVQHSRRCDEAEEAAWLLGIQIVLEIVPGHGESIHRVLAGLPSSVAEAGRRICEEAWLVRIPHRAELVIAAIEGDRQEQSWENFGRALAAALAAVEDDGAILLCTDISCPPGESLQRLVHQEADVETLRQLQRDRGPDATPASLLCEAFDRVQVFLISAHDPQTVEDLGIGYVAGHDEVQRLVSRFPSCLLISDAHRAEVQVTGDAP